ncbi:MAG TPA: CoA transferase [Dehalococcoidia bacterium]
MANDKRLVDYRVLDMTEGGANLAGKVLADFGATVIKIEPPGGSSSRHLSPIVDTPAGPHSLFFEAYNTGKSSVVADITTSEGRQQFLELVRNADAVIESFTPGYLQSLGLGYDDLSAVNPNIVLTSITPYGQTGPKAKWAACDLTVWASGGPLYITGDPDRPPVQISFPYQASLIAASSGAYGTLLALRYRNATGHGQHVDVSMQESSLWVISGAIESWELERFNTGRYGTRVRGAVSVLRRQIFEALDGYVAFMVFGGVTVGKRSTEDTVAWMRRENALPEILDGYDWEKDFDLGTISQERLAELEAAFDQFFRTRTKRELAEGGLAHRLMLAPVTTPSELTHHPQLESREFFVDLPNEKLGAGKNYVGGFAKSSLVNLEPPRRAPEIGEACKTALQPRSAQTFCGKEMRAPLTGLKVANFGGIAAAPLIARQLSLWGATVVRVESTRRVDMLRLQGPFAGGKAQVDTSVWFPNVNSGALGIALDLKNPSGLAIAKKLADWADVVLENYPPGQIAQWGLDYESVKETNPDVIYLSSSLLGQYGPYAHQVGIGFQAAAVAGVSNLTGFPDRPPTPIPTPYTDFLVPAFSAAAIVAALGLRDRTGEGQYIDQSQTETAAQMLAPILMQSLVTGVDQERCGNRHPDAAPHGVFRCLGDDRWIALACMTDQQWTSLRSVLGDSAADSRFKTLAGRKANEDEIESLIATWTSSRMAEKAVAALQAAAVPSDVVATGEDVSEDIQLEHRGFFRTFTHSVIGPHRYRGPTFRLSKVEDIQGPGPALGEHNAQVCELLQLSDDEIAEALISGGMAADVDSGDLGKMQLY